LELHQINLAVRGLAESTAYHRSGIKPCPEDVSIYLISAPEIIILKNDYYGYIVANSISKCKI